MRKCVVESMGHRSLCGTAGSQDAYILCPCISVSVCVSANLRGSETEGCGDGVRPLSVLQHQPLVLSQGQVVTGGQVPQSEGLTPSDVAPAPAVKVTPTHYNKTHMKTYKEKKLPFYKPWKPNIC